MGDSMSGVGRGSQCAIDRSGDLAVGQFPQFLEERRKDRRQAEFGVEHRKDVATFGVGGNHEAVERCVMARQGAGVILSLDLSYERVAEAGENA